MKKTLADFTPEIQAKIPHYIEKYTKGVFDGGKYNEFKKEHAEALIDWNYETSGYMKPVVIVAENPLEAQIFFNYIVANKEVFTPIIYASYCLRNNIELPKINAEVKIEPKKLYSQLDSQLYSQLRSQLDSQLRSQLYSQLDSQLYSQLRSQLDSQLGSQLYSQLRSQLRSQLATYNNDMLFTSNVWSNSLIAWYRFMADELKIDAPINVMLNSWNNLYTNSNVYSAIFSELVCVVSKYPKLIHRNANNDLHNPNGVAVEWGNSTDVTKFECYYLNGREMPKWVVENFDKEGYFEQFMKESNEDIKAGVITLIKERVGNEGLLKFLKAELVDEKVINHFRGYSEKVQLYKTKEKYSFLQNRFGKLNQPYCWSAMVCPSTGNTYLIDNSADFTDAIEAMKFLRPSFVPMDMDYKWTHSAN